MSVQAAKVPPAPPLGLWFVCDLSALTNTKSDFNLNQFKLIDYNCFSPSNDSQGKVMITLPNISSLTINVQIK